MVIKYPVQTVSQYEAVQVAKELAKASGFKQAMVMGVERKAETEWLISLNVSR